jgi:phenylalanine-4-hydroxylase
MEDIEFTPEQNKTWAELYRRQVPRVQEHASVHYMSGFEKLRLPADRIPTLDELNTRITPASGWKVVRTDVRYTSSDDWYRYFERHEFLITNYMRSWEELDWTPEPDMFHDIFGHLPFWMNRYYAGIQEMFAPAYLSAASDEEKENIKRLAWYSTEFGMIREGGKMKVFGTGLMSGGEEFLNAAEGRMTYHDFSIENVIGHDKVLYEQHKDLYVIESLDQLKTELAKYFDPILERAGAR